MKKVLKIFIIFFFSIFFTDFAYASEYSVIQIIPQSTEVHQINKTVVVDVELVPQAEGINAFETEIFFDTNYLELQNSLIQNSLIDFWIERPYLKSDGVIAAAGILPGGTLKRGLITRLVFTARKVGVTYIKLKNSTAGLQTKMGEIKNIDSQDLAISIEDNGVSDGFLSNVVQMKPHFFPVEFSHDPGLFGGKAFVSFLAKSSSSEKINYFIQESSFWKPQADSWKMIESPFVLRDQKRGTYIFLKAVDMEGNSTVLKIDPFWFGQSSVWLAVALVFTSLILIGGLYLHRKKI